MKCLRCGSINTRVLDSRLIENGERIRRRRECLKCNYRFTTFEDYERQSFQIIKPSGIKEPYNRDIMKKSLEICFSGRGDKLENEEKIDLVISNFETDIEKRNLKEIKYDAVEQMIIDNLKKIDVIACVIYSCNAFKFKTIEELNMLIKIIDTDTKNGNS